jgi:hypothetical protein
MRWGAVEEAVSAILVRLVGFETGLVLGFALDCDLTLQQN